MGYRCLGFTVGMKRHQYFSPWVYLPILGALASVRVKADSKGNTAVVI